MTATAASCPNRNSSPRPGFPELHPEQITNEQQSAHVFGDCAVVSGVYRETGVYGKPYTRRGRFTDTWVKLNNTWQCVASQSTLIQH